MEPYITVIVTAFNRQNFVKEAVESVLEQNLARDEYEIIVVNNFNDPEFDDFCKTNNVLSLGYSENGMGQMVVLGIEAAKGEVICFLDDDDTFNEGKLLYVRDLFISNPKLIYYHNDGIYTDLHMNPIESLNMQNTKQVESIFLEENEKDISLKNFLQHVHRFGTSCISIRKSPFDQYLDGIKLIRVSPDIVITTCAMLATGAVYSDNRKLTNYRVWELQWSSYRTDKTPDGINTIHSRAVDSAYGYEVLSQFTLTSPHIHVKRYIEGVLLARTVSCSILNPNPSRKELVAAWKRFVAKRSLTDTVNLLMESSTIFSVLSTIAYGIAPKLSRTIFIRLTPTV